MPVSSSDGEVIERAVREYLLSEPLQGEDPEALAGSTPLLTSGILDSIGITRLVMYLEDNFGVTISTQEVNAEHLNTVDLIVGTVIAKLDLKG